MHGARWVANGSSLLREACADVVHPGDVFVGDAAGQPDLAAEAIEDAGDAHHLAAQHFQGDRFAQLNVSSTSDSAGDAATDESLQLIATAEQDRHDF